MKGWVGDTVDLGREARPPPRMHDAELDIHISAGQLSLL